MRGRGARRLRGAVMLPVLRGELLSVGLLQAAAGGSAMLHGKEGGGAGRDGDG